MPFEIKKGKAWALCPKYICRRVCLPSGEGEVIVRRFESVGDFDDNGPQINLLWEICEEEGAKLPAVVSETEMGKKKQKDTDVIDFELMEKAVKRVSYVFKIQTLFEGESANSERVSKEQG